MKITEIKTLRMEEFSNICYVQIMTDEGICGLGETFFGAGSVEAWIHDNASPILLGKDPLQIEKNWHLYEILKNTAVSVSNLMILVVTAQLFGYILTYYRIPVYVTNLFMAVASNKYVFLILINLLLIIVGMFMEVGATNLILGPILAPIAASFGIDPVHFGLVFVFLLALGQATPPFGTTMFVACGISKVSMADIAKQLLPFIAVEILCGLLFSFVPVLSTWIPGFLA